MTLNDFDSKAAPLLLFIFLLMLWLEDRFALRKRIQPAWRRRVINFLVSLPSFALLRLAFIPALVWLAGTNQQWQLGVVYWLPLPSVFSFALAFLLLDYSLYTWHILLHKIPLLWRFHLVHHSDKDLDLSTALRFHAGELVFSIFYRGAAVVLIGASPALVLVYELAFEAATQFHHSNVRLPFYFEKALNFIIVTPRMHGIHHSVVRSETDSNYATVFSFWDRLHQTLRLNRAQNSITIGLPAYQQPQLLKALDLLKLPFKKQKPATEIQRNHNT